MITKWKVSNFKSIRKETALDIAPLTIFAGANSSGKSTFLQPILLVAQTLAHKVTSRPVILNGSLARLGQFNDLRSVNSSADQISIGWTVQPLPLSQDARRFPVRRLSSYFRHTRQVLSSVSCEMSFDAGELSDQSEISQIQPRLLSSQISVVTRDSDESERGSFIGIRRAETPYDRTKQKWIDASDSEGNRAALDYDVETDEESLAVIREELVSAKLAGCFLRHFLPGRLLLGVDRVTEDANTILRTLAGESTREISARRYYDDSDVVIPKSITDFILELAGSIDDDARDKLSEQIMQARNSQGSKASTPEIISLEQLTEALIGIPLSHRRQIRIRLAENPEFETLVKKTIREGREEVPEVRPFLPPAAVREAAIYIDRFFSTSLRYLGPLRDEPKSLYPLSPSADPSDVGLKGEHTAAVLELHKNRQVNYIPTSAFSEPEIDPQPETRSLKEAVVDWLQYLGVAEGVDSRDRGKLGHELTVRISGANRSHDLTHVGVGVSQVLPILVASLLSDPDTTLIFEQPELHLHPKVQTLLGDFLLSLTQLGKQCILETHSEYLINRIRFRIAAAADQNPWMEAVRIYFVERPTGNSTFREVKVNEYGAVLDWPEGFFDQSQQEAEAILMASIKKRRLQRER